MWIQPCHHFSSNHQSDPKQLTLVMWLKPEQETEKINTAAINMSLWWCHTVVVMMSYGFGSAIVNGCVLLWQHHVGGVCSNGPMGALPPGLQEAVGEDRQQSQDGHWQKNRQRNVTWRGQCEVISCQLNEQEVSVDQCHWSVWWLFPHLIHFLLPSRTVQISLWSTRCSLYTENTTQYYNCTQHSTSSVSLLLMSSVVGLHHLTPQLLMINTLCLHH